MAPRSHCTFQDFELECREGTSLTVCFIKTSRGTKPFWGYNHQTHRTQTYGRGLRWALFPNRVLLLLQGIASLGAMYVYLKANAYDGMRTLLITLAVGVASFLLARAAGWALLWVVAWIRGLLIPGGDKLTAIALNQSGGTESTKT